MTEGGVKWKTHWQPWRLLPNYILINSHQVYLSPDGGFPAIIISLLFRRAEEALAIHRPGFFCKRPMFRVASKLRFIEPQLPSLVDQPPEGKHWIHEVKHDGYRCQVLLERGQARVFTRNGHDWTERYPSFVHAASNLRCKAAIIDGEAIVQNGDGASDFEARSEQRPHSIILCAFDLLHLDGKDLRQQTLSERRANLKALIGTDVQSRIQFTDEFQGNGAALFKACAERALEGTVSKHALAPYRSGRSKTWLKTKCFTESTFVVVGMDRDRKTGAPRALLAHNDGFGLSYAGAAFIALAGDERARFFAELDRLANVLGRVQEFAEHRCEVEPPEAHCRGKASDRKQDAPPCHGARLYAIMAQPIRFIDLP